MSDEPRRRRPRSTARIREGAAAIGAALDAHLPPPEPVGLGEGMLLRARQDAMRNDAMDQSLLGRIAERSDANGKALDALNGRLDRIDDKLEGVAYRRDIEHFMTRSEIETKIKESVVDVKSEVAGLRKVGWGLVSTILLGAVALIVKIVLAAAHIAT